MIRAGVLLAAGASRRFGDADKLLAPLQGRPLVTHAANALARSDLDLLIAVVQSEAVAALLTDFDIVEPKMRDSAQSDSLRAGVLRARDLGADTVTVVLGDMPFVTAELIDAVTRGCTTATPSASHNEVRPMPPACFPRAMFDKILALKGDQGAGMLLSGATFVRTSKRSLSDIDTAMALSEAQAEFD